MTGRQGTVIDSSPTSVEPSSSVQVSTTGPDSAALNLNWMYGFADTAGSKSAANTCLPATVQANFLRILRVMLAPCASLRWPVSMMCATSAFTSTMSPFLASFLSSLMRGLTAVAMIVSRVLDEIRSAAAAADRDLHLLARHHERAVIHFRDRNDVLRLGQADAGVRLGTAARGREVEGRHAGVRIAVGDDQHFGDVRRLGHRALDRDGHRHGVAVLGDLGKVELDLRFGGLLAAGERLDQVLRVVRRLRRQGAEARNRESASTCRQNLPPAQSVHGKAPAPKGRDRMSLPSRGITQDNPVATVPIHPVT